MDHFSILDYVAIVKMPYFAVPNQQILTFENSVKIIAMWLS